MLEVKFSNNLNKVEKYQYIIESLPFLIGNETNFIANLANTCGLLKQVFNWHWIGFYLVDVNTNELVLGPFQGPVACTRIGFGKGVCGQAWELQKTLSIPNVHLHLGHIACSPLSNSEIVIPLIINNTVIAVLDIDSELLNDFGDMDKIQLEEIIGIIAKI